MTDKYPQLKPNVSTVEFTVKFLSLFGSDQVVNIHETSFPCSTSTSTSEGKKEKQAGAELCQAQEKLGLTKPDLPVVIFYLL